MAKFRTALVLFTAAMTLPTLTLSACTTTGNMERGGLVGAGLGGITGAIIGNNTGSGDASTGAAIGAIVGGVAGAYSGYIRDRQGHTVPTQFYYDQRYGRYFYVDPHDGRTYWRNGQFRY